MNFDAAAAKVRWEAEGLARTAIEARLLTVATHFSSGLLGSVALHHPAPASFVLEALQPFVQQLANNSLAVVQAAAQPAATVQ